MASSSLPGNHHHEVKNFGSSVLMTMSITNVLMNTNDDQQEIEFEVVAKCLENQCDLAKLKKAIDRLQRLLGLFSSRQIKLSEETSNPLPNGDTPRRPNNGKRSHEECDGLSSDTLAPKMRKFSSTPPTQSNTIKKSPSTDPKRTPVKKQMSTAETTLRSESEKHL